MDKKIDAVEQDCTIDKEKVCLSNNECLKKMQELSILKKQLSKLVFLNKSSITNCVLEIRKLKKIIAKEKMKINKNFNKINNE